MDFRSFFVRYCPEAARASSQKFHAQCPIPSHSHSGKGSPSLSIDLQRGLFHCFSRDEGGDAIRFYELMHGVSFGRAVGDLARELGVDGKGRHDGRLALQAEPDVEQAKELEPLSTERMCAVCGKFLEVCREENQMEGVNYLARRGIDALTIERAGIVYFPRRSYRRVMRCMLENFSIEELQRSGLFNMKAHLTFYKHRLLFPFYVEGQPRYLQARTTAAGVEPRWHNMRGSVPSLYNADELTDLPSGETVYLVEGFTDTLTLMTHGFAAVGLVGASGFKEEWLAPLARFQIVAALDSDAAGERASSRYQEMFAARGIALARLQLPSDVNDFFQHRPSASLEFALLTEDAIEQ
ncbi:MAG: hypothetical protein AUG51_10560 [Acidobacteria bacterium 13_1_20CM_3_53_8]|nr:MAG: hypothetical protein AUG51_10560 [Acidobacteria bacterium 13_1_20CM_3_53_8]